MSSSELTNYLKPTAANIQEKNRQQATTIRQRKQDSINLLLRVSHEIQGMRAEVNNVRREVEQLKGEVVQLKEENCAVRMELERSTEALNRAANDQFQSINLIRADVNFLIYHALPDV